MVQAFFDWYLNSLAYFWSNILTIRVPHILILILVLWWMCGRGKGRRGGCGWRFACCCSEGGCGCTCGNCCCGGAAAEASKEAE